MPSQLLADQPSLVKLNPPILRDSILKEVVCTRPMREGKFNISLEHHAHQTIVNCYGHGGSGWTTLFGSVNKAIKLFVKANPPKNKPIRVIGAGCMGLTAAIELIRLGYPVAGIYTTKFEDVSSWKAAGFFALISIRTAPEEQESVHEIGMETFLVYQEIERGKHPYLSKETIKWMPVFSNINTETGLKNLEAHHLIPPCKYVSLDFGNGIVHHGFVKNMSYFMHTTDLMRQLAAEAKRLAVKIELKTIHNFDEVPEEFIFNCSGLGGRKLNHDEKIIPVRGHLILLNENAGLGHLNYMIHTKVDQEGKKEFNYMFPKIHYAASEQKQEMACNGVLGGTFIAHVDRLSHADQKELDRLEFKKLLDRHSHFFYGASCS